MKKNSKSFLRNVFFPICLLALAVNFPLNATSDIEDESDSEEKNFSQVPKDESPLYIGIKGIVTDISKNMESVERSLVTIKQDIDTTLSKPSIDVLDVDKKMRKNIGLSKEKITNATIRLEQVCRDSTTDSLKKSSESGKIMTLESLDAFLTQKGINIPWGYNASQIKSLVHKNHTITPSFNVSYDGYVNYSGSVGYSGSQTAKVWDCHYCNNSNSNNIYSSFHGLYGPARCRGCGYNYNDSGMNPVIHDVNIPHSGHVDYKGTQNYKGSKSVMCNEDHHRCQCGDWAEIILSLHEVLEEKDFYKRAYEQQKSQLDLSRKAYEDIKGIKTNLETAENEGNNSLMILQNERESLRSQAELINVQVGGMFELVKNREGFQNQIVELVREFEERERSEKEELKSTLAKKENTFEEYQKQHAEEREKQVSLTFDKIKEKDDFLATANQKLENYLKEQLSSQEKVGEEKLTFVKEVGTLQKQLVEAVSKQEQAFQKQMFDLKEQFVQQEARIRYTLPSMFEKLCVKSEVKGEKRRNYLRALRDRELSILALLNKVEEFMTEDDFS